MYNHLYILKQIVTVIRKKFSFVVFVFFSAII